jgi:cytochrome c biogenesis protein CcmG/thiol:disulfide interchange protein DsbE
MRIALIAGFLLLVALLAAGLTRNPREVPSPLVGKPAPNFDLPVLKDGKTRFSPAQMQGKVWMLNVWASWCVACRDEHPVLVDFAKTRQAPLIGLNYKDPRDDAIRWLAHFGDPYELSVVDADGRIGIDYGVYGVPETYVIDKAGVIRYKQIGPVTPDVMAKKILPLIKELEK